ncbi:hypothetical protein H7I53_19785 [Mycolicibacterium pulveris]|uniref:Uncharacterized protein n=1 Tax=Mycolicibacterium pulveris TaxID=36813 RepID=A0A7I7UTD8_MYCPV|nr:hypothetical protein [Mycolicibacterium pulveris]MCV6982454.1 hypothetical protein [Mycolicibacterium pulveris]BBY83889.1 hypothetical protein MPUL_50470 [Mycolicibacterium pulveris]
MTVHDEVSIAGVPWPVYKVLSVVIGLVVLGIVAIATTTAAPAVLAGAAAATVTWVVLRPFQRAG